MYWTDLRGTAAYPKALGYHGDLKTHPLLNWPTLFQGPLAGVGGWGYVDTAGTLKLRGNIIRMFLLLQRELLQNGAAVHGAASSIDDCASLGCLLNRWSYFTNEVRNFFKDPNNRSKHPTFTQQDLDFYLTDTEKLLEEVKTLVARAPVVN
jgi:hypothetical protein